MGIFNILNNRKNEHRWQIETLDGKHEIRVKMGNSSRDSMEVFLDNRRVDTVKFSGTALIPSMEYNFACGEERITLVLYGNKLDIVYNGKFINSKTEYNPEKKTPIIYRIFMVALALSAIAVLYITRAMFGAPSGNLSDILSLAMIGLSALISYNNVTSPFYSKKKKFLFGILGAVWAWAIAFLISIVFGNLDVFIK